MAFFPQIYTSRQRPRLSGTTCLPHPSTRCLRKYVFFQTKNEMKDTGIIDPKLLPITLTSSPFFTSWSAASFCSIFYALSSSANVRVFELCFVLGTSVVILGSLRVRDSITQSENQSFNREIIQCNLPQQHTSCTLSPTAAALRSSTGASSSGSAAS